MPQGPLAFLPLSEERTSSIVWSSEPKQIAHLMHCSEAEFCEALAQGFDHRLGAIIELGPRYCFPLKMRHVKNYVQAGLALVGDAAHTLHPLAGQGLNLGLADVALLGDLILEEYAHKQTRISYRSLRRYERTRKTENAVMISLMGGFQNLFGTQIPGLIWLRNRGLNLTDRLPFAKNLILQKAMGLV